VSVSQSGRLPPLSSSYPYVTTHNSHTGSFFGESGAKVAERESKDTKKEKQKGTQQSIGKHESLHMLKQDSLVNLSGSQHSVDFDISQSNVDHEIALISEAAAKYGSSRANPKTVSKLKEGTPTGKGLGQSMDDVASLASNDFGLSESNFSTSLAHKAGISASNTSFKGSF
jgi:hypothetical protein